MTLFDIQDYLRSLIDSFAALLDLELTVVSADSFQRVASTGFYGTEKAETSQEIWQQSYTCQVLKSGTPLAVIDTTEYVGNMPAENQAYYSNYSILLYPIRCEGEITGVVVIASFTQSQQSFLIQKQDRLMEYLAHITELIELKLDQEKRWQYIETMNQQLGLIYETMESGVVLYSRSGIERMNERAKQFLCMENKALHAVLLSDITALAHTANRHGDKCTKEIYQAVGEQSAFLTVEAIPLNNTEHSVLCVITPFAKTQGIILQSDGGAVDGGDIVAVSKEMRQLLDRVKTAACHSSNVLILGESGTGKEMLARMIHTGSGRRNEPFVSINCAAIPEHLLEAELFGYESGAFTGARKGGRIGKFMLADRGTLFLDEIGDMPLYLQAKLLRVLSERKVDRIGGTLPIDVDVRIVAATNQDLEEMVANRRFREDLYYRLNVIPFKIPPLRERQEDIIPLAKHFIKKYNQKLNQQIEGLSSDVLGILLNYSWPGNVRELENCLEYMMNFEQGIHLSWESMPPKFSEGVRADPANWQTQPPAYGTALRPLKEMVQQFEQQLFHDFISAHSGHPTLKEIDAFCHTLQISRATYYKKARYSHFIEF